MINHHDSKRSHRRPPVRRPLALEPLDPRILLAVTVDFSDRINLRISGDGAANRVGVVQETATRVEVREFTSTTSYRSLGRYEDAQAIEFRGGAGDDSFTNSTSLPATMFGGTGADRFRGGIGAEVFADLELQDVFIPDAGLAGVVELDTGLLRITGGDTDDYVGLGDYGDGTMALWFNGGLARNLWGFSRVEFDGRGGNDIFVNATSLPSTQTGGAGNDMLFGGRADDVFHGSDGEDIYDTETYSGGNDVLFRDGHRGSLRGPGQTVGLVSGTLTPAELSASGQLTVSRQGNTLTFNGPSGAGFRVRGAWSAYLIQGSQYYISTTPVVLESALGDLTLPNAYMSIQASVTSTPNVGTYVGGVWPGMAIDTTVATSPFRSIQEKTGLGLKLSPTGMQMSLSLGSSLKSLGFDAPVNPAVPYLSFLTSTGLGISFGGASIRPAGDAVTVQGAFDPSDPFLFARIDANIGNNPLEEFALGWSTRGQIPFTPRAPIDGMNEVIHGHVYALAGIKLGSYPVKITGETVLDLDANDDGTLAGLSGNRLARVLRGDIDLATLASVVSDIRIGMNGIGSVSLAKKNASGKELISFSLNVSEATAVVTPSNVAFRARGADLFVGTPLEGKVNVSSFDIQGRFGVADRSWNFRASSSTAGIGGYTFGTIAIAASSVSDRIDVQARFAPPMGFGALQMSGYLAFNGDFSLTGSATPIGLNAGIATLNASATFTLAQTDGAVTFAAALRASFSTNVTIGTVSGSLDASVDLYASANGVAVSGDGTLYGNLALKTGSSLSFTQGFSVSNRGFRIRLRKGLPALSVTW